MKNFKSEIGCVIVFKMLIYRKIRGYSATKIHILFKPAILSSKFFSFLYSFLSIR